MKYLVILFILFTPFVGWAQKQVKVDPQDQAKYGLAPSEDSTYMVLTFDEWKQVLALKLELPALKKERDLLVVKVDALQKIVDSQKKIIAGLDLSLKTANESRDRLTKKWSDCDLSYREAKAGSWKPWVFTGIALATTVAAIAWGGWATAKYKKLEKD